MKVIYKLALGCSWKTVHFTVCMSRPQKIKEEKVSRHHFLIKGQEIGVLPWELLKSDQGARVPRQDLGEGER